ncbi:hypothetical protein PsorP6_003101 [Peronosclerospora sorghi]|uniref:Uncharacterized protein n=1 Tax=Peronosclerospora sorghi TaxID=230839 RepID=A0ACC0VLV7_9STRA|nr:hypothetical protein PsorP6_003101 [Peronosclerospora sorghi]
MTTLSCPLTSPSSCCHDALPPPSPSSLLPLDKVFACAKQNDLVQLSTWLRTMDTKWARNGMHKAIHSRTEPLSKRTARFLCIYTKLVWPHDGTAALHPIHWACAAGNLTALKTLVRHLNVDINTCDAKKQRSPLLIAAQHGQPMAALFCVRHGANVHLVDADGDTAVHWAAYQGATDILAVLHYLDVNSDARDSFGQTPLHLAAMRGHLESVEYLVETLEADVQARDAKERTPCDLAQIKHWRHVVQYLRHKERHQAALKWWCERRSRTPFFFSLVHGVGILLVYGVLFVRILRDQRHVVVPHVLWCIGTWWFFYRTVTTKPGRVDEDSPAYAKAYEKVTDELIHGNEEDEEATRPEARLVDRPLCHTCHIERPARSKHCRVCKTCVPVFDHHCPFVDNCVGRNNYVVFLVFLVFLTGTLLNLEYMCYLLYHYYPTRRVYTSLAMLYVAVLLAPVTHLTAFHLYLTARNRTTNEVLTATRYRLERGKPLPSYDRGVFRNVTERCCGCRKQAQEMEEEGGEEMNLMDAMA